MTVILDSRIYLLAIAAAIKDKEITVVTNSIEILAMRRTKDFVTKDGVATLREGNLSR